MDQTRIRRCAAVKQLTRGVPALGRCECPSVTNHPHGDACHHKADVLESPGTHASQRASCSIAASRLNASVVIATGSAPYTDSRTHWSPVVGSNTRR